MPPVEKSDNVVDRIFTKIKEFLDDTPGPQSASKALDALHLASCFVGRDKTEEATCFKAKWEEVKDRLASMAERSDFVAALTNIERNIDEAQNPQKYQLHKLHDCSSLAEGEALVIKQLTK